ncbi:hypothetical protein [Candidatus Uabimicrobium amorphum]|uniref:Uncharacterized protein n=1 Tax=Uabimicrobium amorphum TaxID=2596890 RepID=A0A5S9IHW3_UABAM|nr:hypothetical protein [Candidatus Uabimicrobium amorphum]BBM81850.1 hypothetical protein UABAM_00191 [Candidatus Uabimicrobium amorphum]
MKKFILFLGLCGLLYADFVVQFVEKSTSLNSARVRLYEKISPILPHGKILQEGFVKKHSDVYAYVKMEVPDSDFVLLITEKIALLQTGTTSEEALNKINQYTSLWSSRFAEEYYFFNIGDMFFCVATMGLPNIASAVPLRFSGFGNDKNSARTQAENSAKAVLKEFDIQNEQYRQMGFSWMCDLFVTPKPMSFHFRGTGLSQQSAKAQAELFAKGSLGNYIIQKEDYQQFGAMWLCNLVVTKSRTRGKMISIPQITLMNTLDNDEIMVVGVGEDKQKALVDLKQQLHVLKMKAENVKYVAGASFVYCVAQGKSHFSQGKYSVQDMQIAHFQVKNEPIKFMFTGIGLSKQQARSRAEFQAKLMLGSYNVEKEDYVQFGAMFTCYLLVTRQNSSGNIALEEQVVPQKSFTSIWLKNNQKWVCHKQNAKDISVEMITGKAPSYEEVKVEGYESSDVIRIHYDCEAEVWKCWVKTQ